MVMTYFGKDEFGVNIFSSKCCEILYSKVVQTDVKIEDKKVVDLVNSPNHFITNEKNGALFLFNVSWSDFSFFRLVIRSVHLNGLHNKVVCIYVCI